ncbi:MAG: SDR family NAD(P)-dependent oxidoreductase [Acidimicrobiia bacterium]
MEIAGTSAVVTGGASGLGEAVVRRLCAAGSAVVICDRDAERGKALAGEVGATFAEVDVRDTDQVTAAVAEASAQAPLRVAVNCAGIGAAGRVVAKDGTPHDLELFERIIAVNLVGTFNMLRVAAAAMKNTEPGDDGERGVVVNTSSIAAFDGQVGQIGYAASKAGVVGLTLPAARDLGQIGVRVVTICPGVMHTPMLGQLPQAAQDQLASGIPFPRRLGLPDDFAALVEHIVANPYLNGEVIRLDGGLRMAPR